MNVATVEGEALARVAFNALAFIPKATKVPFIRVSLSAGLIEIAGSDGYASGKDSAPVHNGPGLPVAFALEREGLVELEATARACKKEALSLTVGSDNTLTVQASGESLTVPCMALEREAWAILDRLYADTEAQAEPWWGTCAFDPALLGRFGKVKTAKDRVADYLFTGPERPVLVKVGPTFRGLVMPLYREPAAEYADPEGLW